MRLRLRCRLRSAGTDVTLVDAARSSLPVLGALGSPAANPRSSSVSHAAQNLTVRHRLVPPHRPQVIRRVTQMRSATSRLPGSPGAPEPHRTPVTGQAISLTGRVQRVHHERFTTRGYRSDSYTECDAEYLCRLEAL
nr:hypothetical protein JVH1_8022 [Rhodococcus sp. JVH1]